MSIEAKDGPRSDAMRYASEALTQNLRACWSEPVDTFITGNIPLLLTKLSRIPAIPATGAQPAEPQARHSKPANQSA
ncbi:hypothetical protein AB2M62_03075 [Sphingomonas sp. MMS12-HWE2-04]|uniref:hypothetical protein n=1 Tax=Sphingomonas sp. MMS12-HWE2-04 TaxID=3234199 RepID=UPI00384E2D85